MTVRGLAGVLAALLLAGAGGLVFWRCEGEAPALEAPAQIALGRAGSKVELRATDARSGLRRVKVALRHAAAEPTVLVEQVFPGQLLAGAARRPSDERVSVPLDPKALGLAEGEAFLDVEVVDWSWRSFLSGNVTQVSIPVHVDLKPPRAWVESGLTYVQRGGAGAVVYALGEPVERDGVEVGGVFFRGYPLPDAPPSADAGAAPAAPPGLRRFALFAIPRDAPAEAPIHVVAEDAAGNRSVIGWQTRFQERVFEDVRINLDGRFLQAKVPQLADTLDIAAPDVVAAFQEINIRVRAANEKQIQEIVSGSTAERLWQGAFQQFRNAAVTSRFAEHRTYYHQEKPVSEAIHYGYDLASTAHAEIAASNAGRVLFAGDHGIYGGLVVVDHGQGLTSLYAHLSRIDVAPGDAVALGQTVGLSGATGLAGGDHLHFAVMVGGVYVDPKEWWDPKWVQEHVEVQLAPEP